MGSGTVTANGGISINIGTFMTMDGKTLINPAGQTATWGGGSPGAINLKDGAQIVNDGTFKVQDPAAANVNGSAKPGRGGRVHQ